MVKEKMISYFKKELSSSLSSFVDEEKMTFEEAPLHGEKKKHKTHLSSQLVECCFVFIFDTVQNSASRRC